MSRTKQARAGNTHNTAHKRRGEAGTGTAQIDDAGDQAPFLPQIRDGYKYLGLEQLEQDSLVNFKKIEEKAQAGWTDHRTKNAFNKHKHNSSSGLRHSKYSSR